MKKISKYQKIVDWMVENGVQSIRDRDLEIILRSDEEPDWDEIHGQTVVINTPGSGEN